MKYLYKLFPVLFVAVLISCDGGGGNGTDPEPELSFEQKIVGTWNLSSVKIDGSDVSSDYDGFKISFDSNFNYTITNGGTTFPQTSGGYSIQNSDSNGANISIGGLVNVVTVQFSNDDQTITLSFTVDTTTFGLGGRESGLAGNYVFVLNK